MFGFNTAYMSLVYMQATKNIPKFNNDKTKVRGELCSNLPGKFTS